MSKHKERKNSAFVKRTPHPKLSLPENYIQDKVKMAIGTLQRMNKSKTLYNDLIKLVIKQVSATREVYDIGTQISAHIQKIGSLHPGDLGLVLSDIGAYCVEIDKSIKTWSDSLYNDLVVPLSNSMDGHIKEVTEKLKQVKTQNAAFNKEMQIQEKIVTKAGKLGQIELVEAIQNFNQKKDEVDKKKADILLQVLFMERSRYTNLIENFLNTLQVEILLGRNMDAMSRDFQRWKDTCNQKDTLSEEQINALATASEQTFKQLPNASSPPDSEPVVVLYKSTSLGLKNLDEVTNSNKPVLSSRRSVRPSFYVSRATLTPNIFQTMSSGMLDAILSPRDVNRSVQIGLENIPPGYPMPPLEVNDSVVTENRDGTTCSKMDYQIWEQGLIAYKEKEKEGKMEECKKIADKVTQILQLGSDQPTITQSLHAPSLVRSKSVPLYSSVNPNSTLEISEKFPSSPSITITTSLPPPPPPLKIMTGPFLTSPLPPPNVPEDLPPPLSQHSETPRGVPPQVSPPPPPKDPVPPPPPILYVPPPPLAGMQTHLGPPPPPPVRIAPIVSGSEKKLRCIPEQKDFAESAEEIST